MTTEEFIEKNSIVIKKLTSLSSNGVSCNYAGSQDTIKNLIPIILMFFKTLKIIFKDRYILECPSHKKKIKSLYEQERLIIN